MTAERWKQVRPLFFELAEIGPEDRAVRLESLSKTDPELHAQLRRLLAAHGARIVHEAHPVKAASALARGRMEVVNRYLKHCVAGREFDIYR